MLSAGKYAEGQTRDPKTWKANFRCAMNSLPDIKEVKDRSVNKGHQAVRVFKMLPAAQKCRGERGTDQVEKTATLPRSIVFHFCPAVAETFKVLSN